MATISRDTSVILGRWRDETLENTDDYVRQDLRRIDLGLAGIHDRVRAGDLPAIDRWIRLLDHRAKLVCSYEPAKLQADVRVRYLHDVQADAAVLAEFEVQDAAKEIIEHREG